MNLPTTAAIAVGVGAPAAVAASAASAAAAVRDPRAVPAAPVVPAVRVQQVDVPVVQVSAVPAPEVRAVPVVIVVAVPVAGPVLAARAVMTVVRGAMSVRRRNRCPRSISRWSRIPAASTCSRARSR